MLRFELRHNMYLPLYLSHALCHPSTGVPVCLSVSPGFRREAAPPPGYHISPLAGALISAGIRPQGIPYKLPIGEFFEVPNSQINVSQIFGTRMQSAQNTQKGIAI